MCARIFCFVVLQMFGIWAIFAQQLSESDGTATKLDALGPIVVGKDGSMGLVSNWATMSEAERATAQRLISKRNEARLLRLREQEAEREATAATLQGRTISMLRKQFGRIGRAFRRVCAKLRKAKPRNPQEELNALAESVSS
mmetsp:Transcript_36448/g.60380  ORF Transcript_36448/g.60380 Transcript_36448/m.60380 type:complete len:142 (+) Transcript_36448:130-555(+)